MRPAGRCREGASPRLRSALSRRSRAKPARSRPEDSAAGAARLDGEGLRRDQVRGDARPRPPLAHRFPLAGDVAGLQVAKAAVQRAVVLERRGATEVVAVDQRRVQAARGRVPRGHQAVNAPADDEDVELSGGQGVEVAMHGTRPRSQRAPAL